MSQQPKKFEATSANITDEQKAKLESLFPEIVTEGGKIDFDRLKLTLGQTVDNGKERYGMNWPGKSDCFKTIQRPSMATLVPARDESVNFDTTENLIIEGDNLETLKLLQKAYLGRVKMVFIDPPYNTGNDFIYPDDFSESLETYLRYTGQVDNEGRKFSTNTETDGRFHSKWMNMMYPRLFLARNLLADDGVIFISIDDGEVANLRKLCDETFGEDNFVATIIWQKKFARQNDAEYFSTMHDYILCIAKNAIRADSVGWKLNLLERTDEDNAGYTNPDNDPRGPWTSVVLSAKSGSDNLKFVIKSPSGRECLPPDGRYWGVSKAKFAELVADNRIWFGKEGDGIPRLKTFLKEVQSGLRPNTIWFHEEVSHNQEARQSLKELLGGKGVFDSPKPIKLIQQMIRISGADKNSIILDFFGGSGSTGHAVLEQNKQDGGNRKFILVQLPEQTRSKKEDGTWEESDAWKAGYSTIAEITKDRIRRAINKMNEEDEKQNLLKQSQKQDRGFKVFKLQSSNFKAWNAEQPKDDAELVKQLTLHTDHLVEGRAQEDVLYELLLKSGFPLTTNVEKITLAEKNVFSVADGMMLICLEKELTLEVIKAMAEKKPERVVCLDAGFADNDQLKTNAVQTMKSKGVTKFQTV
jgi:adenine-specific DNA-methyltransferase